VVTLTFAYWCAATCSDTTSPDGKARWLDDEQSICSVSATDREDADTEGSCVSWWPYVLLIDCQNLRIYWLHANKRKADWPTFAKNSTMLIAVVSGLILKELVVAMMTTMEAVISALLECSVEGIVSFVDTCKIVCCYFSCPFLCWQTTVIKLPS